MEKCIQPADQLPKWNSGWGVRHTQAALVFTCLIAVYALRLNLTMAVVAMATSPYQKITLDSGQKALVLSSFFWGYSLLQTYLGNLGRKKNATIVFAVCIITSSVLSLATPLAALYFGAAGIIVVRLFMGIVQGGIYPNVTNLLAAWVVPQEKDAVFISVYNGSNVGTLLALASSGYLAANFDWPSIFYASGISGIIISGIYLYWGRCRPEEHEGLSKEENEFIRNSFGVKNNKYTKKLSVPWRNILTSVPLLALTCTHWCTSWGFWSILSLTPTYLNSALGISVEKDGIFSALSSATAVVLSPIFAVVSVFITKRNILPVCFARFMWNSIGTYGTGFALIGLAYTEDAKLAVALITIANGLNVGTNIGYMANHTDLSPNFSGVLYALTNSIANTAAIIGPLVSTYMLSNTEDFMLWREIFLISAGIIIFGNTVFLLYGTTETQKWNDVDKNQVQSA